MSDEVVARKQRASPLFRKIRQIRKEVFSKTLLVARYSIIPALILSSLYMTEPKPTLFELLNPLY